MSRDAEEILAAAVEREAIALEIEEQIAARRLGQAQEAVLGSERQDLVLSPLQAACFQLDRGLVARALERFARPARRFRYLFEIAEPLERVDVQARAQLLDL